LYYTMNAAHSSFLLHEELVYFRNDSDSENSVIDHDTTSKASIIFTILILIFSSLGIFTTCLLLYGLHRNYKILLVPWIANIVVFIIIDFTYLLYSLVNHALQWNPFAAVLITIDFFLNTLNMYALLCVISQYQEFKAGRGRARDDQMFRIPSVHYNSQPTATSFFSSRKPVTYYETKPTPTQSPTGLPPSAPSIPDILSPNINSRRESRKSVKFPDNSNLTLHNGSQLLDPWSIEVKSPMLIPKGIDTAPLLDPSVPQVTQSSV
ncbi:hypothetical protein NQ315_000903, partial [Exocentrus adspersus]